MTTNKENQMSIISEENIKKALKGFKLSYRDNIEKYEKENVKVEDVVTLSEGFSGKSTLLATTVILSVMVAMPPKEFIALMETMKSLSRIKLLESMREIFKEKMQKSIDNDIDKLTYGRIKIKSYLSTSRKYYGKPAGG